MQMVNSIRSGADVSDSLDIVLEQLSKEQMINIKEYGQKLNPIVMFYMVLGVIVPSLGISVGLLILSFAGWTIGLREMWAVIPIVAIMQYMFLSYAEITRPVYEV
jgi:flagellar protein FlaJ